MRKRTMRIRTALLCFALAAAAPVAQAGAFSVAPLGAELGAKAKATSFTVTNAGKTPLSFQVAVRRWTQDAEGKDVYEDTTKDLVVFPRQFEIPAGGKRIVRVGIEGAPPAAEAAYRVFIEELPPAASASQGLKGTVAVVGRFALPVFIVPAGAKGKLAIDSVSAKGGTYSAKLSNTGASRVRLASLGLGAKETDATLTTPYLLAGTRHEMTGPLGAGCKAGATVKVVATADGGQKAEKDLVLPPDACRA
jgi:fimbrial chaperone protein